MKNAYSEEFQDNVIEFWGRTFLIKKRFESKKNRVYLVSEETQKDRYYVLKIYTDEFHDNLQVELSALERMAKLKIPAPEIIYSNKDAILLEYLPGKTIMELINDIIIEPDLILRNDDLEFLANVFKELGNWFAELHARTLNRSQIALLKGDCTLKNFIYNPNIPGSIIFAVDFEESVSGPPLLDFGALSAAVLTIKPTFSQQNFAFLKIFINSYNQRINKLVKENATIEINSLDLANHASQALIDVSRWRSSDSARELQEWAERIKKRENIFDD
jgi:tRNA A-37 threonylcarbamoyl transferase component Bud32